ncbi:MAG: nuclear transport factor 2 family protein [Acidimicrobiales bacterium]|nr:nuclear transport factor 2 family protein [Acidimicrobiales bacterium]
MGKFSNAEVEEAFAEYRRRGVGEEDWAGWAQLFTDDAVYIEHFLGRFNGAQEIGPWIEACMAEYKAMTLWMDWWVVDDDRVALYIWNNLPDPTGTGKRYGFPNTTVLHYAGGGQWDYEEDFYNPADATRVWTEWFQDGGRNHTPQDHSLEGIADWAPAVPEPAFPADEVDAEFHKYRERGNLAVATGDWDQWADQFTADARYREHHYGTFDGQDEIRAWITKTMGPFPDMYFPLDHYMIDGNRVIAVIPNCLPDPAGDSSDRTSLDTPYRFDVHVILHYAGEGKWSYEEDVYNPKEAEDCVAKWVHAGGQMPKLPS